MSMGNDFDAYGKMLSSGADMSLALQIAYGKDAASVLGKLQLHYGAINAEQSASMISLANNMLDSAVDLNALDPGTPLDPAGIPVNPMLFGDDPGGRRAVFSFEFQIIPGGKWYRLDIEAADFETPEQIRQRIIEEAERRVKQSPGAFGTHEEEEFEDLEIRNIANVRRF